MNVFEEKERGSLELLRAKWADDFRRAVKWGFENGLLSVRHDPLAFADRKEKKENGSLRT